MNSVVPTLLVVSLLLAGCTTGREKTIEENRRRIDYYTTRLPSCDRVDIFHLNHELERNQTVGFPVKPYRTHAEIISFKSLAGGDAQALAAFWRSQTFGEKYQAMCHEPVYGFRFYDGTNLLFETSLCFSCRNFYIPIGDGARWWGFDSRVPKARDLLTRLQQIFPASVPKPQTASVSE